MDIEVISFGSKKITAITVVREVAGLTLEEASNFVDSIEEGSKILRDVSPESVEELRAGGAIIKELNADYDEFADEIYGKSGDKDVLDNVSVTDNAVGEKAESVVILERGQSRYANGMYIPIVETNMIGNIDREETMKMLIEVAKIAKESEEYDSEAARLVKEKKEKREKMNEIRNAVSGIAKFFIWTVTIVAFLVGLVAGPLCIVTGIGALIFMNLTVKKADLKKHEAENNANADAYYTENILPIESRLDEIYKARDELVNSGRKSWAIDVVGKDMFYSACIEDIYYLIKNRRADTLKEALNKYDDTQHKARIEEMQAAIQNASEISARESVKQTEYSKEIAKNSHQAATAAKATAYNTRQIDKNTRNFR